MLVFCGIPLLYMEMAVGQLTRFGPIKAFGMLCPLMKGGYSFVNYGRVLVFIFFANAN